MRKLPTNVKRTKKSVRTSLVGYLAGVSSFDLSRLLGAPETRNTDSIYSWRLEVKDDSIQSKPFYIDLYDYNVKDANPETPIEDIFTWNIASDYKQGARLFLDKLFPYALITKDYWSAVDYGEKHLGRAPKNRLKVVAITEEQFLDWDSQTQHQWIEDHPTSKFADLKSSKPKSAVLKAKGPTPEEKAKKKEADFLEKLKDKTPEDREAILSARADGVAIPPSWTNIKYTKEPVEGVYATGLDEKGRGVRVEDAGWREQKIVEKHARIQKSLEPRFNKIVATLKERAINGDVDSQVLYLMAKTAIRIGADKNTKAKEKAYGATTLLGKHVKVEGDKVTLDFTGKKGVHQVHTIKDPVIASFLKDKEPDERIFKTNDSKVREAWTNLGGEKPHDIRSLIATRIARKELAKVKELPTDEKGKRALLKQIAEAASKKLGNAPSEALSTYIDHNALSSIMEAK